MAVDQSESGEINEKSKTAAYHWEARYRHDAAEAGHTITHSLYNGVCSNRPVQINRSQGADDYITARRLVESNSGGRSAMGGLPDDPVPGPDPLDDVYSRFGIRPICRGPSEVARRYPGHRK
jgi:hypothetical protein